MVQKIKLKNISLLLFLLGTVPTISFAATDCSDLGVKPQGICVGNCSEGTPSQDILFFTYSNPATEMIISLSDYPTYINAALNGQPLTAFSVPMCFGVFTNTAGSGNPGSGTVWNNENLPTTGTWNIGITLSGNSAPSPNEAKILMPEDSDQNFFLLAEAKFCKCSALPSDSMNSEIGAGLDCQYGSNGTVPIPLNTETPLKTNDIYGNTTGICADGNGLGGFVFNIYTPNGTIPPVGKYMLNFSVGVCPPGQTC